MRARSFERRQLHNGTALIDADAEIHYHFADGPPSVSRITTIADAFADHPISCNA